MFSTNYDLEQRLEDLENTISSLKKAILHQNELILSITKKLMTLEQDSQLFFSSIGNTGVKQSINKQSTSNQQSTEKNHEITIKSQDKVDSIGNTGVQEPIALIPNSPSFTNNLVEEFKSLKNKLNSSFKALSRQELKTFLTLYELEENGLNPSYKAISYKMQLSEPCIRAHICSLFKKGIPIEKTKVNNRLTLIFIKKDFKSLNLHTKLIELYHKSDPDQTTLL
jgi:hypothetical protein